MDQDPVFNEEETDEEEAPLASPLVAPLVVPSPVDHIIIPLNSYMLAAIMGNPFMNLNVILRDQQEVLSQAEQEEQQEQEEQEQEQEERIRRVRPREEDAEEEPSAKVQKTDHKQINYKYVQLNTDFKIHLNEDDDENTMLNERAEPNTFVRRLVARIPASIKNRLYYLSRFLKNGEEYVEQGVYSRTEEDDFDTEEYDEESKKAMLYNLRDKVFAAYIKECRLRTIFRRVLQRWRVTKMEKRYSTESAEVDPITLSPPEKEVYLYDWTAKKKFVFDAKSLATFIESKLLYNEGGFALPQYPCNPWTNVDLTHTQMISIYNQLRAYGELRWGLITMRQYDFNKNIWHRYHHSALTMSAIKNSLIRLDTFDARELLIDFMLSKIDELQLHPSNYIDNAYRAAISKAPTHWYVEECKAIAIIHYEATHFGYNKKNLIDQRCLKLFKKQKAFVRELVEMRIIRPN